MPVIDHVPSVVARACLSTGDPLSAGATVFAGAEPAPVGGPPALARIPGSNPSLPPACPVDPEVSSKPAQVVGFVPPTKVARPPRFGEIAPENKLFVYVDIEVGPSPRFGPEPEMLLVRVSPVVAGSPLL